MSEDMKCTMCGSQANSVHGDGKSTDQIESGVHLIFDVGYGMFTDIDENGAVPDAILCHDCTKFVLALFPNEFRRKFFGGHHESMCGNDQLCVYAFGERFETV